MLFSSLVRIEFGRSSCNVVKSMRYSTSRKLDLYVTFSSTNAITDKTLEELYCVSHPENCCLLLQMIKRLFSYNIESKRTTWSGRSMRNTLTTILKVMEKRIQELTKKLDIQRRQNCSIIMFIQKHNDKHTRLKTRTTKQMSLKVNGNK